MTLDLLTFESASNNPYHNLAVEKYLFDTYTGSHVVVFYLWQNERTVVIGRNQDARTEVHLDTLEAEGGFLARRPSGGGAVYHDRGNLNFSFLVKDNLYDVQRQMRVLLTAAQAVGVRATLSGRNDVLSEGFKFSGSAYYRSGGGACHHGTVLVDTDFNRMSRYLNVSEDKLKTHAVQSVQSRVVNLRARNPSLTIACVKEALYGAFNTVFGGTAAALSDAFLGDARVAAARARFASREYLLGSRIKPDVTGQARFAWGGITLELAVSDNFIVQARVYTDALDETMAQRLSLALTGCVFSGPALKKAALSLNMPESRDIGRFLQEMTEGNQ